MDFLSANLKYPPKYSGVFKLQKMDAVTPSPISKGFWVFLKSLEKDFIMLAKILLYSAIVYIIFDKFFCLIYQWFLFNSVMVLEYSA